MEKYFRNFDFDFEGYLLQQNGEGRGGTPYKHRQGRLQFRKVTMQRLFSIVLTHSEKVLFLLQEYHSIIVSYFKFLSKIFNGEQVPVVC